MNEAQVGYAEAAGKERRKVPARHAAASVLPQGLPRIAVEAGVSDGWYKYVGLNGAVIGLDRFGESAPADLLRTTRC